VTGQKDQAGERFAGLGQQRRVKAAKKLGGTVQNGRKPVEMKNTTANQNLTAQSSRVEAHTEELFNPQEWEALLNSFENDASVQESSRSSELAVELSTEDLWERLSSTRWIRTPSADDKDSTVAQRPMD
jgi:hypothetical protein